MKRLIVILMACMALVACQKSNVHTILPHHAQLAFEACARLQIELKSFSVEYDSIGDLYWIRSNCGDNVRIEVFVPRKIIPAKEA